MKGVTYFKLNSNYEGDVTKNCQLTSVEVDTNFYNLAGRDIKSVSVEDDKLHITLVNGEVLATSTKLTENTIKELNFSFDSEKGELTITKDGEETKIGGFVTKDNNKVNIYNNGTIVGDGTIAKPLGISPIDKTGQYAPVIKILDVTKGEKLPSVCKATYGERYITKETVNPKGLLYNYEALKEIACQLREAGSAWRIPTKDDWDDMLNAIEPNEEGKNHEDGKPNKRLGEYAGALLKNKEGWKEYKKTTFDSCGCRFDDINKSSGSSDTCPAEKPKDKCKISACNADATDLTSTSKKNGLGAYGFNALPVGYANDGKTRLYEGERAYFWTATNEDYRDAYIKVITNDKDNVLQDIVASDNYMSVRLVKDYTGNNFNEREDILGKSYTTALLPSVKDGSKVWMTVNLAALGSACNSGQVIPTLGDDEKGVSKYFINEWDGEKWLKRELKEGDSVVALKPTDDSEKTHVEYRLVNGKLVDITVALVNETKEIIQTELDDLQKQINDVKYENLEKNDEQDNLIDALNTTTQDLSGSVVKVVEDVVTLSEDVERLKNASTATDDKIDEIKQELENSVNEKLKKVHIQEGSSFNPTTGKLFLKSEGGENDIELQVSLDFGHF